MRQRLALAMFLLIAGLAPAVSLAGTTVALSDLEAAIFGPSGAPAPFLAGQVLEKATCTQTACPGGGSVTCSTVPPNDTCKVRCGGVKCEGQDFIKCPSPCCTQTFFCWDGSVITCRNWRLDDCSRTAEGVECDGICPPFNPCVANPCHCDDPPTC